ncbi:MAG: adenylyl-sulfate kinase [Rhodospirillales bacterium]|nr:adenylyl-sulfate kinase [Rhodospirillales bacterium]
MDLGFSPPERDDARAIAPKPFQDIHVNASFGACERRDPKGHYDELANVKCPTLPAFLRHTKCRFARNAESIPRPRPLTLARIALKSMP